MPTWNPWHGCRKISPGCLNCYVYRLDEHYGRDPTHCCKTADYLLPLAKNRQGEYKITATQGCLYTCFTSDFLLEQADAWRAEAWRCIKLRPDLQFCFFTKRIHRLQACLPDDWGPGYPNVTIGCTVENQTMADQRLPIFLHAPIRQRMIICEPLLSAIDLSPYLSNAIIEVMVGGESGPEARICNLEWIQSLKKQCQTAQVKFTIHQTGAKLQIGNVLKSFTRSQQLSQVPWLWKQLI